MVNLVSPPLLLQQVWDENEDRTTPAFPPWNVSHKSRHTHVLRGRRMLWQCDWSHIPSPGMCVQVEPWGQPPTKRGMRWGGEGVFLLLSLALSSMTSHRLSSLWCFCASATLWREPNFTEKERGGSRDQRRLSAMTDGWEGILYHQG